MSKSSHTIVVRGPMPEDWSPPHANRLAVRKGANWETYLPHAIAVREESSPGDDRRTGAKRGVAVLSLARAVCSPLRHAHSAHSAICGEERDAARTALPPPSDSN
jgi:hypothetical protein